MKIRKHMILSDIMEITDNTSGGVESDMLLREEVDSDVVHYLKLI